MVITIGDFNAKTGTGKNEYPENIGKYGKGKLNTNGRCLLEYAKEHDMIVTNTMFNHKMCHRTTWTAPNRITEQNHHDGNPRRNPCRNQIDYVLIKNTFRRLARNSSSYFETNSDHKAVIMNMKLAWWKMTKKSVEKSVTINIEKISNEERAKEFKAEVEAQTKIEEFNMQDRYQQEMGCDGEHMSKCSKEGTWRRPKLNNNRYENEEILKLSEKQ